YWLCYETTWPEEPITAVGSGLFTTSVCGTTVRHIVSKSQHDRSASAKQKDCHSICGFQRVDALRIYHSMGRFVASAGFWNGRPLHRADRRCYRSTVDPEPQWCRRQKTSRISTTFCRV